MTTTTLPITITIEVTGTFVPGNLHRVRDEEPQGDTFDDLNILALLTREDEPGVVNRYGVLTAPLIEELLHDHREAIIEALLAEHSKSAP